jgi:hypothetical protein
MPRAIEAFRKLDLAPATQDKYALHRTAVALYDARK